MMQEGKGELTIVSVIIGIGVQLVGVVAPEPMDALFIKLLVAHALDAWSPIGRAVALASRIDNLFMVIYGCDILNAMSSSQGWIFT